MRAAQHTAHRRVRLAHGDLGAPDLGEAHRKSFRDFQRQRLDQEAALAGDDLLNDIEGDAVINCSTYGIIFQGMVRLDVQRDIDPFAETFATWLAGDLSARVDGGESGAEVVARANTVLQDIADAHPGETVLVIAHGGILTLAIRNLLTFGSGVKPKEFANCAFAETELRSDGWRLTGWSDLE